MEESPIEFYKDLKERLIAKGLWREDITLREAILLSGEGKMKEEFNLSRRIINDMEYHRAFILRDDVKEFIKRLKEEVNETDWAVILNKQYYKKPLFELIDKLAGEELI